MNDISVFLNLILVLFASIFGVIEVVRFYLYFKGKSELDEIKSRNQGIEDVEVLVDQLLDLKNHCASFSEFSEEQDLIYEKLRKNRVYRNALKKVNRHKLPNVIQLELHRKAVGGRKAS